MGPYQLSLHGAYLKGGDGRRKSMSGGCRLSRVGKEEESPRASYRHSFFQPKRVANCANLSRFSPSPPRHSTACCDGLTERREVEKRVSLQRARAVVPLQDLNCIGHSFRSEDSESLALWEEKEQSTSCDHGWMKLPRPSPRWLDAVRKFDTMKLAPWRSSPVHPKSSFESPRRSLDSRLSRKSSRELSKPVSKASWLINATKKGRIGGSRSVRCPAEASNLLQQSRELTPSSIPSSQDSESLNDSKHGSSSRMRDMQFTSDEVMRFSPSSVAWDISSKPAPVVEKVCLVNGVSWEILADEVLESRTESARDETTTNAQSRVVDYKSASKHIAAVKEMKATDTSLSDAKGHLADSNDRLADRTNAIDKHFKTQAAEIISSKALQPPPSSKEADVISLYEALRQRYILKLESSPLDSLSVVLPKTKPISAPRAQSAISKPKGAETDKISESFLSKSRSSNDFEGPLRNFSSQVENSSAPERLFTSLRDKVFRSTRPGPSPLGKKKNLRNFLDSSSPRSTLCGPDEGSVPSSNPSLRSDPGVSAVSVLPNSASQSFSSSGLSFDLNGQDVESTCSAYNLNGTSVGKVVESRRVSLSFRDFGPSRSSRENAAAILNTAAAMSETSTIELQVDTNEDQLDTTELRLSPPTVSTPELLTSAFSPRLQQSNAQPDSPCTATERESSLSLCSPSPARRLSGVTLAEFEEQMPSVVPSSRSQECEFTARLGGVFSPRRLISKCDDKISSNQHNCFAASTLSPPHDDDLGARSPAYASAMELLSPTESCSSTKQRRSKTKAQSSNRRHSSEGADSPTMMVTINKAMKKILSKCSVKRTNSNKKSKVDSPALETLPPADFLFTEIN